MKQFKIHFLLFTVALIYGMNYNVAKWVMPTPIPPFAFILIRVSLATVLFWILHKLTSTEKIQGRKDWGRLILCAFFGVAINQLAFFHGLSLTSPINASLIMTAVPILVLIASYFMLGEKITKKKLLGILLGGTGAVVLLLNGRQLSAQGSFLGDILILVNATFYSLYLVNIKPLMKRYKALTVVKWIFLFGLIIILPFTLPQLFTIEWGELSVFVWASIIYVVVFTTFFAYLLNAKALETANPSLVGFYIYVQPICTTFITVFLQGEPFKIAMIIPMILIFSGTFLVSRT